MIKITGKIGDSRRTYNGSNAVELLQEFLDDSKVDQIKLLTEQIDIAVKDGVFPKKHFFLVDGKVNNNLASVKNLGQISAVATAPAVDVLTKIYDDILFNSPIVTGLYRQNNFVLLNGKIIANNPGTLRSYLKNNPVTSKDVLIFVNRAPYARRLEYKGVFGKSGDGGMNINAKQVRMKQRSGRLAAGMRLVTSNTAPNGAYYRASSKATRAYKSINVRFTFKSGDELGFKIPIRGPKQRYRTDFAKGNKRQVGRAYLYPAIEVRLIEGLNL